MHAQMVKEWVTGRAAPRPLITWPAKRSQKRPRKARPSYTPYPKRDAERGIAGTRGAYDPCPQCGHPRVRHISPRAALEYIRGGAGVTRHCNATVPGRTGDTSCKCNKTNDFVTTAATEQE